MPLFKYKCERCNIFIEKLQFNSKKLEISCNICGELMVKALSVPNNRVALNAADNLAEKIIPDVNRLQKELDSGKDSAIDDLCGEK